MPTQAIKHGILRGVITANNGGKFGAGFAGGFISSAFSVATSGYGNTYSRTAIMAVVGGTASHLTGGKFVNGAFSGAFIYLFNDAMDQYANKIAFLVPHLLFY